MVRHLSRKSDSLKQGEVKLLFAIWQVQNEENFLRGVSRKEILKLNNWNENQFYSYFNDLRSRLKNGYVLSSSGKSYSLATDNLITKVSSAKILLLLQVFLLENKSVCNEGLVPYLEFVEWVAKKLKLSTEDVKARLKKAAKKQYLMQKEQNGDVLYIESNWRMICETEWINLLASQN